MRSSVEERWFNMNAPLEAVVSWMYLDIRGLVTVGVGNLLPNVEYAVALPFVRKDTLEPATEQEIRDDFAAISGMKSLAKDGHRAAASVAKLRLTGDGMHKLVMSKFHQNAAHLKSRFRDIDEWPAAAQAAVASLAWACGPAFRFPKLEAHLRNQNFKDAVDEIHMNEYTTDPHGRPIKNGGLVPRNYMNKALMLEAAFVKEHNLDRDELWYPMTPSLRVSENQPIVHDMNSYFPERNKP